jgi:hypothetical protein
VIAIMSIGCGDNVNCRDTDTAMWQSWIFQGIGQSIAMDDVRVAVCRG